MKTMSLTKELHSKRRSDSRTSALEKSAMRRRGFATSTSIEQYGRQGKAPKKKLTVVKTQKVGEKKRKRRVRETEEKVGKSPKVEFRRNRRALTPMSHRRLEENKSH